MLKMVFIGLFVLFCLAVLMGLVLLFTKYMLKLTEDLDRPERADCGKILKTRLALTMTLPRGENTSKPPYESSAVIVHTKTEFLRMAGYWWDHRLPGQTDYDKFEAISQP